jgi:hypothetical protein
VLKNNKENQMTTIHVTKIKTSEYLFNHHNLVFLAHNSGEGHWSLYNLKGTEINRDSTKKALINALNSYDKPGTIALDNQESANK